jgi:hypothetical protein
MIRRFLSGSLLLVPVVFSVVVVGLPAAFDAGSPEFNIPFTLSGPLELISFDIPFVAVPDVLIWTVDRIRLSGDVLFQWSNPPTVGSSPDYAWAAGLRLDPSFGVPANFMARIDAEAVPEPGMAWALVVGILLLVCRKARRRDRAG